MENLIWLIFSSKAQTRWETSQSQRYNALKEFMTACSTMLSNIRISA